MPEQPTMDSCEIDSELMNQFAAAQAIPDTTQFKVVCDENNEPMVFSLGNKIEQKQDPAQEKPVFNPTRFNLLKKDASGQYQLIDFGLKLGLPAEYKGDAINVTQHVESKILFIALSTSTLSDNSDLHLLKPVKPQELNTIDLKSLIMSAGSKKPAAHIVDIFVSPPPDADTYPSVFLTYAVLNRIVPTKDIARVDIKHSGNQWSWELGGGFELPTNPDEVLALTPVVYKWRGEPKNGVAALWKTNKILELAVISFDGETTVSLPVPDGSSTLGTVASSYGYTHMLVGGTDLWYYTYSQLLDKRSQPTKLLTDKTFDSANQLHVAQSTSEVAIWAESSQKGISYILTKLDLKNPNAPVQLIPDGAGGHFAAFKATNNATEHFLIATNSGQLSVLKQNAATKFWQDVPLAAPNLNWTIKFQSYVTHVLVKGTNKQPLLNHNVHLSSSVPQDILVNGRSTHTGSVPVTVKTDSRGYLLLSNPTDDISSADFTVSEASQVATNAKSIDVVPRDKIDAHLSKIKTGTDLRNARLQNGAKLIPDNIPVDLDQVAKAISHFLSVGKPSSMLDLYPVPEGESRVVASSSEDSSEVEAFSWWDDALDVLKEGWHAFVHTGKNIGNWILKQVTDGYHLFVELGTAAYKWVVKTAEEAWKAIYWVFKQVLKVVDNIIDWIGFIFDWGDIKKTHQSIVHVTKGLLETAPNYVDSMTEKVNSFFDKLETDIDAWGRIPPDVGGRKAGPSSVDSDSKLSSTKVNWAITQFHHGGGANDSKISDIKPSPSSDPIKNFWSQACLQIGNQHQSDIQSIGHAFKDWNPLSSSASLADVMKKIAVDLIRKFIQALRTAATKFLSILKTVVKDFNDVITATIDIPIFSWLYKKFLSGGSDLSLLDGLALVVAIPATILCKIITNRAPPDMTGIKYDKLIHGGLSDKESIQFSHFGGIITIFAEVLVGIVDAIETFIPFSAQTAKSQHLPASDFTMQAAIGTKTKMYVKDAFAVVARAGGIPLDKNLPGYDVLWASWSVACVNSAIGAALRRVELKEDKKQVEKILAVIEGVLGTVNFGLIITVKVKEFEDAEYSKKYRTWTIMDCLSGTFDEVSLICGDVARFDPEPETKAALETINLALQAFSYTLQGIQFADKHSKQIYYSVKNKVN